MKIKTGKAKRNKLIIKIIIFISLSYFIIVFINQQLKIRSLRNKVLELNKEILEYRQDSKENESK
ncbi:MAG: hypothetical protein FWC41_05360 [Firmicutes bacterium]|nr:hypothetical protein [Bacillota bacterium]